MEQSPLRVLAISGSLRDRSLNTEILLAAAAIAAESYAVELYEGLAELPHFNPDHDREGSVLPPSVVDLRARIAAADTLLISSPEYAHGVPGSLKNALDWLVSGPEMLDKPVALLSASGVSLHAPAALAEILRTMSARVVPLARPVVPLAGRRLDAAGILADPELAAVVRHALEALDRSFGSPFRTGRSSIGGPPT